MKTKLLGLIPLVALLSFAPDMATAASLVVNGDFSAGDTGFSSDYSDYTNNLIVGEATPGQYAITIASNIANATSSPDWTAVATVPNGGDGNVLVANGDTSGSNRVLYQSVTVSPNTLYAFSFYGVDVNTLRVNDATLQVTANGTAIGTLQTNGGWQLASFDWSSGLDTSVVLSLVDLNTNEKYNDFAVDDLSFSPAAPLPAALPLFATGLGGLGLLGWRRKRKNAAAIAAA